MPICFLSPPFHTDLLLIWEQMHIVEGTEIKIISTVSITLTPLNNSHLLVFLSYFRATEIQSLPRYFLSEEVLFGVYLIDGVAAFLSYEEKKRWDGKLTQFTVCSETRMQMS